MNKKSLERSSNFELLRIVSMILIVVHHFVLYNSFNYSSDSLLLGFLNVGGKLGVVLFAMITGYYMYSKKDINLKKIILLELQVLFYSIGIFLVFVLIDGGYFNSYKLLKVLFPNIFKTYWFFSSYFILYLCIPYLNKLIKVLTKDEFGKMLVILFIFIVLIPSLAIGNNNITEGVYLFYYYMVGAYISKYVDNSKISKYKYLIVFLVSYTLMVICNFFCNSLVSSNYNSLLRNNLYSRTCSIFIFGSAIGLFMFFKNLRVRNNKYINMLASYSFGVYLFHEHFFMRDLLWNKLFTYSKVLNSGCLFINLVIMIIGIYLVGSLVEFVRKCIFKYFSCKMGFGRDV